MDTQWAAVTAWVGLIMVAPQTPRKFCPERLSSVMTKEGMRLRWPLTM